MKAKKFFRIMEKRRKLEEAKKAAQLPKEEPAVKTVTVKPEAGLEHIEIKLTVEPEVEPVEEAPTEDKPLFEGDKILVREAAKTLGITNRELCDKLEDKGIKASHSSKVDAEVLNEIAAEVE